MDTAVAAQPAKPRRRWLRFSLRSAFLLITVLCVGLGFKVNAARRQQEAVTVITKAGGFIGFDYQLVPGPSGKQNDLKWNANALPPGPKWLRAIFGDDFFCTVVTVQFSNSTEAGALHRALTPADFVELGKLRTLKSLVLYDERNLERGRREDQSSGKSDLVSRMASALGDALLHPGSESLINDAGLEPIGKLTSLETLSLSYNRISDKGLKYVGNLTNLVELDLTNTNITGEGFRTAKFPRLNSLGLGSSAINDSGLAFVGMLTNLKSLNLENTHISDAGLEKLHELSKLENLDLNETHITGTGLRLENSHGLHDLNLRGTLLNDSGMEQVGKITSLRVLLIDGTQISDAGLAHLKNLSNLKTLNVSSTNISNAGLKQLASLTNLKELIADVRGITYEEIYELQKSLPTTKIGARPLLAARKPANGEREKSTSLVHLSPEERAAAAPIHDESGAKWAIWVSLTERKSNLLGRASVFAPNLYYISFKNYLAERNIENGRIEFRQIRLPGAIEEIVGERENVACTLRTTMGEEGNGDILDFGPFAIRGVDADGLRLQGHSENPWRLVLSPGPFPEKLISCSDDGTVRLWELKGSNGFRPGPNGIGGWSVYIDPGQEVAKFPGYARDANGNVARGEFVAFSPFGHWLVTAFENKVSFRSPKDGTEQFAWKATLPEPQRIMAVRFDVNGNTLLAFPENMKSTVEPSVKFLRFDLDQRQEQPFRGTHGVVDGRATVDGKFVITWDGSAEIVFWDAIKHTEAAVLNVAPEHVYDVAFSPLGDVMATAGDDGEVKFWKVADQSRIETKQPYRHEGIDLVQFNLNGRMLFTGSEDGLLRAWDAPACAWDDGRTHPIETEFRPDGTTIEKFQDGTVKRSRKQ